MLLTLGLGGEKSFPSFCVAAKEESKIEPVGPPEGLDHGIQGHEGGRHPLPSPYNEVLRLCVC